MQFLSEKIGLKLFFLINNYPIPQFFGQHQFDGAVLLEVLHQFGQLFGGGRADLFLDALYLAHEPIGFVFEQSLD